MGALDGIDALPRFEDHNLVSGFLDNTPPAERWQELTRRKLPEVDALIQRMLTVRPLLEECLQCDFLTLNVCANQGWNTRQIARF